MKKLLIALPMVALLAACSAPSVDELVDNPKKLEKIMAECEKLHAKGKNIEKNQKCQNAVEATSKLALKGISNLLGQ